MIGLAAAASMAVAAFVGVAGASADSLCLEPGHHASECPLAQRYTGNVVGLTEGKTALLLNASGGTEVACEGTVLGLGPGTNEGAHVGLKILQEALEFKECSGICNKATGENPSFLLIEALTLDAFVTKDGAAKPAAKLEGCPFGIACKYELKNEPQLLSASGNTITATKVPLTRVSGFCPSEGFWDATYHVTKDEVNGAPVYLAALP